MDGIYIPELTGACICVTDGLTFTLPPSQPGLSESGSLAGGPSGPLVFVAVMQTRLVRQLRNNLG